MKSKSFDVKKASVENNGHNKTFEFIGFYKSTEETNKTTNEKLISDDNSKDVQPKESPRVKGESLKCERTPKKVKKKKNEPVNISQIDIDGTTLNGSFGGSTSLNNSKMTSTPNANTKSSAQTSKVKSIMKNTSEQGENLETSGSDTKHNSKKRNKSVSFMLDDNEEIVVKKIKPDESKNTPEQSKFFKTISLKKYKKGHHSEKENKGDINQNLKQLKKSKAKETNEGTHLEMDTNIGLQDNTEKSKAKKMYKKLKKLKKHEGSIDMATVVKDEPTVKQSIETKSNKKHKVKAQLDDEGPSTKTQKMDIKPDVIAEDLGNLNIGDNAHTLSNLLDEMAVVDKNKRKKLKSKLKKKSSPTPTTETSPTVNEGEKEKVKWKKRKWNKDKKGDMDSENLNTSVIVENIPISMVLTYRKILTEHFEKYGPIKKIGIAEVYPTEESKPVFTTTVYFYSDGAATEALQQNNSLIEGSRIKVKRPLPSTETTIVLRSYAELNEQNVASLFTGTGKIRNIRNLVKGKKAMSTAFVEFDGPVSVERAMKKCKNSKIGSKKVHISKFEERTSKKKPKIDDENVIDKSDSEC